MTKQAPEPLGWLVGLDGIKRPYYEHHFTSNGLEHRPDGYWSRRAPLPATPIPAALASRQDFLIRKPFALPFQGGQEYYMQPPAPPLIGIALNSVPQQHATPAPERSPLPPMAACCFIDASAPPPPDPIFRAIRQTSNHPPSPMMGCKQRLK